MAKKTKQVKERTPLGVRRMKLSAEERKGYVRRWVNDKPGRIDAARAGGYEFVRDPKAEKTHEPGIKNATVDQGSAMVRNVNSDPGLPEKAYLMEIKKSLYDKDQKEKHDLIDQKEEQIMSGKFDPGGLGKKGYVPEGGISINRR